VKTFFLILLLVPHLLRAEISYWELEYALGVTHIQNTNNLLNGLSTGSVPGDYTPAPAFDSQNNPLNSVTVEDTSGIGPATSNLTGNFAGNRNTALGGLQSRLGTITAPITSLPSVGTQTGWSLATVSLGGTPVSIGLDMSSNTGLGAAVPILRMVLLVAMAGAWAVLCVQTIREGL